MRRGREGAVRVQRVAGAELGSAIRGFQGQVKKAECDDLS